MLNLVKKAQKGDDEAFYALFQPYEQDIFRMAFVYVKNQNDALDVVQETAYRSFRAIKTLKEPEFFKTWLLRIAVNCSLDVLRKQKSVVSLRPEAEDNLSGDVNEEDISLEITIRDLIEQLDEGEKGVILLRFFEDLSLKEIAETLDIPLGTAKTILYRALYKLRKNWKGANLYG